MGIAVMIMGQSGTGKSASLRNFTKEEVSVINVAGKPLPFRSDIVSYSTDNYVNVVKAMKQAKTPSIVIDDSQYLMANEYMRRAGENGFQKFTDIGRNYWALVNTVRDLPKDKVVYFLQHTEMTDSGKEKAKTIGKLLDEKITVEGMFTIVLKTDVIDGRYVFRTQNNGSDTVKSPMGMFDTEEVENDLREVDKVIREYYGLTEEKEEQNETV